MSHWSEYIATLPMYDRVLIAHGNPNNMRLIDRAVEKARMDVRQAVSCIMADAQRRVDAILRAK